MGMTIQTSLLPKKKTIQKSHLNHPHSLHITEWYKDTFPWIFLQPPISQTSSKALLDAWNA